MVCDGPSREDGRGEDRTRRCFVASSSPSSTANFAGLAGAKHALSPLVLKLTQESLLKRLVVDEAAQDLIEYALLAGLISLVAVVTVLNVGTGVNTVWTGVGGTMGSIPTP